MIESWMDVSIQDKWLCLSNDIVVLLNKVSAVHRRADSLRVYVEGGSDSPALPMSVPLGRQADNLWQLFSGPYPIEEGWALLTDEWAVRLAHISAIARTADHSVVIGISGVPIRDGLILPPGAAAEEFWSRAFKMGNKTILVSPTPDG